MSVNQKGFQKMPVSNSQKAVGMQGSGGSNLKGSKVMGVSNPKGIEPTKIGGGMPMSQGPVQPKVGK